MALSEKCFYDDLYDRCKTMINTNDANEFYINISIVYNKIKHYEDISMFGFYYRSLIEQMKKNNIFHINKIDLSIENIKKNKYRIKVFFSNYFLLENLIDDSINSMFDAIICRMNLCIDIICDFDNSDDKLNKLNELKTHKIIFNAFTNNKIKNKINEEINNFIIDNELMIF